MLINLRVFEDKVKELSHNRVTAMLDISSLYNDKFFLKIDGLTFGEFYLDPKGPLVRWNSRPKAISAELSLKLKKLLEEAASRAIPDLSSLEELLPDAY